MAPKTSISGSASASLSASASASIGGSASASVKGSAGGLSASFDVGINNSGRTTDHHGGFNFSVELSFDGIKAGAFRSVEGLAVSVELIDYQGGGDMFARQIPGRPKIAPVVLKKGYVNSATLWEWMRKTMEGTLDMRNVTITLLADDGQGEMASYHLYSTWPSSWKGWQLDANSSNAMVEEIELQVRGIERVE